MAYPDNTYPADPDFPEITIQAKFDLNWYNVATAYLADICEALVVIRQDYIKLSASGTIGWEGDPKISWNGSAVVIEDLEITEADCALGTISIGNWIVCADTVTINGGVTLEIALHLGIQGAINVDTVTDSVIELEQIAEPDDPTTTRTVIWLSNGTGSGDAGDLMCKLRYDGVTKTTTLVDFA